MRISISRSWESLWVWLFWAIGIWLVLELGPFFIAALALRKSAGELAGPYLAFAVPWAIMAPLIWWLKKWEERSVEPKRLARACGVSTALFGVVLLLAGSYSGVKLGILNPMDALGGLILSVFLCVPIFYFTVHHMVMTSRSSRARGQVGGSGPK